jgi:hypothetical protein
MDVVCKEGVICYFLTNVKKKAVLQSGQLTLKKNENFAISWSPVLTASSSETCFSTV